MIASIKIHIRYITFLIVLLSIFQQEVAASCQEGLIVSQGKIEIRMEYNACDYNENMALPIQQPNEILFAIIALLNHPQSTLSKSSIKYKLELWSSAEDQYHISVWNNNVVTKEYEMPYSNNQTDQVYQEICNHLQINCTPLAKVTTVFISPATSNHNIIYWGPIPSFEANTSYTIPSSDTEKKGAIPITRRTIHQYFIPLSQQ